MAARDAEDAGAGADARVATPADAAAPDAAVAAPEGFPAFALGVEYAPPGLGRAYGDAHARWVKPLVELVQWNDIEPTAPVGGVHSYVWTCVDAAFGEYQAAGMRVQAYLSTYSSWGSAAGLRDYAPSAARAADFAAWVKAVIERYDGDGVDDMPGLVTPVRHWVIGGEWTGFWPSGSAAGYLATLQAVRAAARAASPEVLLGAIPLMDIDVFDGDPPSAQHVAQGLADPPPGIRNTTAGYRAILDRPDLFDYLDVHSLGDYTEIPPLLAWMRAEMAARGYAKPIWIDDAYPTSLLANGSWPIIWPVTQASKNAVLATLNDVARAQEPAYTPAMKWLRAEAAKGTIQKATTAIGEGAIGINVGNTEDWCDQKTFGLACSFWVPFAGAEYVEGMADVEHPNGFGTCVRRGAVTPRPAMRDFTLLADRIGDGAFDSVTRIVNADPGVRGYAFVRGATRTWIVWYEDRVLQLQGQTEPRSDVSLAMPAGVTSVTVTEAITDIAATTPVVTTVPVAGGAARLSLSSVPVFVSAAE